MKFRWRQPLLPVLFAGLAGFLLLAFCLRGGLLEGPDRSIQALIFSWRTPVLTTFMVALSYSGNWQFFLPLCLILLLLPSLRKAYGLPLTLAALSSVALHQTLKSTFCRARPDSCHHLLCQEGYSFPSGHSLTTLVFYGLLAALLYYYYRSRGTPLPLYQRRQSGQTPRPFPYPATKKGWRRILLFLIVYTLLMGFSRVYVGVHWPSDVLGSWFLGAALLCLLMAFLGLPPPAAGLKSAAPPRNP